MKIQSVSFEIAEQQGVKSHLARRLTVGKKKKKKENPPPKCNVTQGKCKHWYVNVV